MTIPDPQRERQAADSLRGYVYQLYATVIEWADLASGGTLLVEVAEDYASFVNDAIIMYQVKQTSGKVTLRSPGAVAAITSLWQYCNENPKLDVRLTYLTTSLPGREREFEAADCDRGLDYWGRAADGADTRPLRSLLATLTLPDDLKDYIATASDQKLRDTLLKRLTWACGEPPLMAVIDKLDQRLIAMAMAKGEAPDAGKRAGPFLIEHLLRKITQSGRVLSRRLTREDFDLAFHEATTTRVSTTTLGKLLARLMELEESKASLSDPAFSTAPAPEEPKILRIAVSPFSRPRPRPVNVLMTLGVSRQPAIAVISGIDAAALLESMRVVESMIAAGSRGEFEPRFWEAQERPVWQARARACGMIWTLGAHCPKRMDLVRALAGGFQRKAAGCGDILVLALPHDARAVAAELAGWIGEVGGKATTEPFEPGIPVYLWAAGDPGPFPEDPLLPRLMASLEEGASADNNPKVRQACRLLLDRRSDPSELLRGASEDVLRLHDRAVVARGGADDPYPLDARRGVALIRRSGEAEQLLHALAFLPVGPEIVEALGSARDMTRAVAGLLTADEVRSPFPPWPVHRVDGYRPARAGAYFPDRTGGDE